MSLRTSPSRGALVALLLLPPLWSGPAEANSGAFSLVGDGGFFMRASAPAASDVALTDDETGRGAVSLNPGAASLFRGRASGSLFAHPPAASIDVAQIMNVIASAEAGKADYDAVQHGARIKPPVPPTRMTLAEIYDWIAETPGQPHAIGRYQFIPATLKRLVENQEVPLHRSFSPKLQDQLAHQLIEEAGLSEFKSGQMSMEAFMNNLAKIWAGLPTSSGKSYYDNYAGNKATMTWASFKEQMHRIFTG